MYLIYHTPTGHVWRHADIYVKEANQMKAGVNGELTLIYPNDVSADVFEISDEDYNALDTANISKYIIQDGEVILDPNWVDPTHTDEDLKIKLRDAVSTGLITSEAYMQITGAEYVE